MQGNPLLPIIQDKVHSKSSRICNYYLQLYSQPTTSTTKQHYWQQSNLGKSKLQQTIDDKMPKDHLFFVEPMKQQQTNLSSRRASTALGIVPTLGTTADNHNPTIFNKQSMSTALNSTLQTTSTPEPRLNLHPQTITKQTQRFFTKHIEMRERDQSERAKQQMGILKEQQYSRTKQEAPQDKGKRNSNYQSPSLVSNEIFYLDYKGQPKPNAHRSSSLSFTPDRTSRSQTQLVVEVRNQFMMNKEGAENRTYGKKVSLNMKNYSSLSIGENDGLRQVYERSASNLSARTCITPKMAFNNNLDCTFNDESLILQQKIHNNKVAQSVSMYASPKRLNNKIKESQSAKGSQSFIFGYDQDAQLKSSNFVNTKIGHEEAKIVWPSKVTQKPQNTNQAFNRYAKMIPESQPKKGLLDKASNEQSDVVQSFIVQKQSQPNKLSNSIADSFSGDQFKYIHSHREQSREKMRDVIVNKYLLNNSNMSIHDSKDKIGLQQKYPDSVSLEVGRDDSQQRKMLNMQHGAFLSYQIKSHHMRRQSEQIQSLREGKLLQNQWSQFKQQRDDEEKQKKLQDQEMIAKGLHKIQMGQDLAKGQLNEDEKRIRLAE